MPRLQSISPTCQRTPTFFAQRVRSAARHSFSLPSNVGRPCQRRPLPLGPSRRRPPARCRNPGGSRVKQRGRPRQEPVHTVRRVARLAGHPGLLARPCRRARQQAAGYLGFLNFNFDTRSLMTLKSLTPPPADAFSSCHAFVPALATARAAFSASRAPFNLVDVSFLRKRGR